MTSSNRDRAERLERTLRGLVAGDRDELHALLTPDVRTWAPEWTTSSLDELLATIDQRDDAFADASLDVVPLDVGGDHACAEWTLHVRHVGEIELANGDRIAPTGTSVEIHGVSVAEFTDDRICSLRQYWDVNDMVEQLTAPTP